MSLFARSSVLFLAISALAVQAGAQAVSSFDRERGVHPVKATQPAAGVQGTTATTAPSAARFGGLSAAMGGASLTAPPVAAPASTTAPASSFDRERGATTTPTLNSSTSVGGNAPAVESVIK